MGYRLTAKNYRWWSLLICLLSVASIRRKLLKRLIPKNVAIIQIQKFETYDSDLKKINFIPKKSSIIFRRMRIYSRFNNIFDLFLKKIVFSLQLVSRLALDFRTFMENMKMSSSLLKILEPGINVFKSNSQITKKKIFWNISTIYECVEKLSMII